MSVGNLLPNCQWQLWSDLGYITKMNALGSGSQNPISISSFSPGNSVTFNTLETEELKIGDLFYLNDSTNPVWDFWDWNGGPSFPSVINAQRVTNLVNDSSFTTVGHLGSTSRTSKSPLIAIPTTRGDPGARARAADGWNKSTTITCWPDDFSANACIGAIRTLGLRKGAGTKEELFWKCGPNEIASFRGREISFGALVYQKAQTGAGTWNLRIDDGIGSTPSGNGTGSSYSDPTYGGFEFLWINHTVSNSATQVKVSLELTGANADVYYCALPTASFVNSMSVKNCRQNPIEIVRSVNHWNSYRFLPLAMTFPSSAAYGSYYGYSGQDLEALTFGQIHNSVAAVKAKNEYQTSTVGKSLYMGNVLNASLSYGSQACTNVSGTKIVGQGWFPLHSDGTFAMFCDASSLSITSAVFDFDMVALSMPVSSL